VFTRLTMLAIVLAAVCTPRGAEASKYSWNNVNGDWTNPINWTLIDGPFNEGFPNRPGDEAHFTTAYTSPRTVTIPDGRTVTLGAMIFSNNGITINAEGTGRMRLQHTAFTGAVIMRTDPAPSFIHDAIKAPIELRSDLTVTLNAGATRMGFYGTISNNLCACGVTKLGPGTMLFHAINTYLGQTRVERGMLDLILAPGPSVRGSSLVIGPVAPQDAQIVAEVRVDQANQIANDTPVEVKRGGALHINENETVGATIVDGGTITVTGADTTPYDFTMASLTMTGGSIDSYEFGNITLLGTLTATSGAGSAGARIKRWSGNGYLSLGPSDRTFDVTRGAASVDLTINIPMVSPGTTLIKQGNGVMLLESPNLHAGETRVMQGELRAAVLDKEPALNGPVRVGQGTSPALLTLLSTQNIRDTGSIAIGANGTVELASTALETMGALTINAGGRLRVDGGGDSAANLAAESLLMRGGRIDISAPSSLRINGAVDLSSASTAGGPESALIAGGRLALGGARTILVGNGPGEPDATVGSIITGSSSQGVTKTGDGTLTFTGNNTYGGATTIMSGRLNVNGKQPASPVVVAGGILGGKGTTGRVDVSAGAAVSPGDRFGRLSTGAIAYAAGSNHSLGVEGSGDGEYGQLAVTGTVTLSNARFNSGTRSNLSPEARYLIIDNDGSDPVVGTFEGLDEGGKVTIGGVSYTITYRGGDGNDVVIEGVTPTTYYLAEGATGAFFDDDVLIANPNDAQAPVTLTFLREGGATAVVQRVIPAKSRVTIHVDQLEGLEDVSASVKVDSIDKLPLIVERTMFWDQSYYGGHTANAVAKPEKKWTFAEGFQGFFDTYILIANANATKTTATLTFLRENATPVVKTVEVDPFTRKTIHAGEYDELKGRAFGIVVEATEPVIAERSMYFANPAGRIWAGGHVNTGIVAPSRSWFHAEGATGGFFSTFVLLSNPQDTAANIEVKFLLDTGEVITKSKTLDAKQRVTINPAGEDPRLENASVSTVVESDVPIVSERSMYWEGDVKGALGEGHNSSGIAEAGSRWGLAEGRVGGPREFVTYILLANPTATKADVRITYLRENGLPIVKEYEVAATSRFNVDVKTAVPELQNSSFGAIIEVLNDVPIAVERSLYWNALDSFWAGGTNALATRLPPVK
jgi:autotransporter-associated beta strand protein